MTWIMAINTVSILFAVMTTWLMVRYLRKYKLPHTYYKRLFGFVRIRYLLGIYALSTVGLAALTTGLFYTFFV
ncbi:MAG: hypothetical protein ACD_51C00312G0009 [uncultured bacterium]|nr:MAG: hypothetical protein ACD_51C00312G0009 [uncultured bacterium]OGJ47042.1 MAG: hypothetical protein A2244_04870 [Candidatus Peregrinibacteria bacterium RIFOXYA2_FULL_41_18]OGJ49730.1 MAG: hypothetical protein A2344_03530 [Candidatus Peregrinibacteria bacterium RIFOXYB12_FULL_41_12]OGJ53517.1 MAG: hypothetical protein A2448_01595 [Candidatus Peregrinibacteria bacterium RIFOXYC2_FULL_41_22]OGJ53732.1 MAG: hypothetical protein A2336_04020 [Candidatus Peregrinibacteria bacterium RIFOXYB2_FULL